MKRDEIGDWIQIVATIGVVAGLMLVAIELRQNSNLARAEMNSQMGFAWQSVQSALRDREFAAVFRKSIEQPHELEFDERLMIHGYYRDLVGILTREMLMIGRGVFVDDSKYVAAQVVRQGLGTEYGRTWWAQNKVGYFPSLVAAIDEALKRADEGEISVAF